MISKIKPQINILVESIVKPISKNWNPNVITILTIFISLIPMYLFANREFIWGALSLFLFSFDLLDGAVARIHNKTTKFGGYLDAVCDRFSDGMVYLGLALSGVVRIEFCILALITGFLVSYSKAKGEAVIGLGMPGTNELSIGFAERGERLAIIFVFSLIQGWGNILILHIGILEIGLLISAFLSILTIIMRVKKTYTILK